VDGESLGRGGATGYNNAGLIKLELEMYLAKCIVFPLSEHKETPVHEHFNIWEWQFPFLRCEQIVIECLCAKA
jgi:hypothetical protein